MARFVIHIGPHKTGTTYLQHGFTRLRPAMAERGIVYPDAWGGGPHGHHLLATLLTSGDTAPLAALASSGADTVLLSSESFAYSDMDAVRRLHAAVSGAPATIVFYARRWSELIPAGWREQVKHGSNETLPEFALGQLRDPIAAPLINFAHVLERWASVFGADALRIVSYNAVMDAGDDLLAHFCRHFLQWADAPPTGLGRINQSLNMVDAEVLRALNVMGWAEKRERTPPLYDRYMDALPHLPVRRLVEIAMRYTVDSIRLDDTPLMPLAEALAARYRQAMVEPLPASGLFAPQCVDAKYIRTDYLFIEGAMGLLRQIRATLLAS